MDAQQVRTPAPAAPMAWLDQRSRIHLPGGPEEGVDWLAERRASGLKDGDDFLAELRRHAPDGVLATAGGGVSELRYHPDEGTFADPPKEDPGRDPARAEEETRRVTFVASDETTDRHGTRIIIAGWLLDYFLANPVCLWNHDRHEPPVGRAETAKVVGKKLLTPVVFTPPEISPFGYSIYKSLAAKFLNACSVAFRVLESFYNQKNDTVDFTKTELLEVSVVSVPSNPNALVKARSLGVDLAPIKDWCLRTLAGLGGEPGAWINESALVAAADALGWNGGAKLFEMPADKIRALRPGGIELARKAAVDLVLGNGDRADVELKYRAYGQDAPWLRKPESWSALERGCALAGGDARAAVAGLLCAAGFDDEAVAARGVGSHPDTTADGGLGVEPEQSSGRMPSAQVDATQAERVVEPAPAEPLNRELVNAVATRAIDQALAPLREAYTARTGKLILPN